MKARVLIGWVTLDRLLFSEQFESADAEVQLIGARQVEADTPEVLEGSPGLREHTAGGCKPGEDLNGGRVTTSKYVSLSCRLARKKVNHV